MASADGNTPNPPSSMDTVPARCSAGCGFFGNANTGGMCSKCYKETLAKSAAQAPSPAPAAVATTPAPVAAPTSSSATASASPAPPAAAVAPPSTSAVAPPAPTPPKVESPSPAATVTATTGPRLESDEPSDEPPKKKQVNTNRCWTCNKKIGLLGFQCKCDYYFCAEHRYSDKHACSFDFKALGKQQLSKANPTIAPSKLESM